MVIRRIKYNPAYCRKVNHSDNTYIGNNLKKRHLLNVSTVKLRPVKYTFLLMNPSDADLEFSDSTVNKVIKDSYNDNVDQVDIVNALPFYETDSTKIENLLNKLGKSEILNLLNENYKTIVKSIETTVESGGKIICGWGNIPSNLSVRNENIYSNNLKRIKEILIKYPNMTYCYGTNNDGSPTHPLYVDYKNLTKFIV
ncbi:DUF1643 domain-containing protein [Bacillus altitudinis]|uniref:DUF1643 domain-containing protein n=1 Tax=Bacillus altitudinis TaxID=293387 RepID=UPI00119EA5E7|nr:DUF1643 domain-containing protein [Bacillus altitudinis]